MKKSIPHCWQWKKFSLPPTLVRNKINRFRLRGDKFNISQRKQDFNLFYLHIPQASQWNCSFEICKHRSKDLSPVGEPERYNNQQPHITINDSWRAIKFVVNTESILILHKLGVFFFYLIIRHYTKIGTSLALQVLLAFSRSYYNI